MTIKVFTDGACSNNGKANAKAGLGVYFNKDDPRNTAKRIMGKQSNNTAELSAVLEVFTILETEIKSGEEILIYSDSIYTIRWCNEYGKKKEQTNWVNKNKPIPNLELGKKLYLLCKNNPNIHLKHIKAHTGLSDELSLGNEGADRLANEAIGSVSCPYDDKKQKFYLNVPYSDKEKAKSLGSRWDPQKKKWYYLGSNKDDNFKQLIKLFPI
jgi:ribonuclease HI